MAMLKGKSISAMQESIKKRIEGIVLEHRRSTCERLEELAYRREDTGKNFSAGRLFEKASRKARHIGDNRKGLDMMLRAIDSYENYASRREKMAREASRDNSPELAISYLSDAMTGQAHAAYLAYIINEPTLQERSRRLLSRAERNNSVLEANADYSSPNYFFYDEQSLNKMRFLRRVYGD